MKQWDVFISHASPDKGKFVLPLAELLKARGVKVWLDQWSIGLGDSISASISEGLRQSRFGIVVLSREFFARAWPKKELGALFAQENEGANRIIPLWHQIEHAEVLEHAPLLADRMAARSDEGLQSIVDQILQLLAKDGHPQRFVLQPTETNAPEDTSTTSDTAIRGGTTSENRLITIDPNPFLQGKGKTWDEPVYDSQSVKSFLDIIWTKLRPSLPAHTYGEVWVLRNRKTQEVFWDLTNNLAAYHGLNRVAQTLNESGILPGMILEIVPLTKERSTTIQAKDSFNPTPR
jgi:hypothetical protein